MKGEIESATAGDPREASRGTARAVPNLRRVLWSLVGVVALAWLFLGGGLSAISGVMRSAAPSTAAEIGQAAPALRLPLAGGGEVSLAHYRGKVLLVNFWATWCAPCRAEMPAIDAAYRKHRERGFEVLAVDVQERDEDVLAFLGELGVSFPSAVDRDSDVARRYRALALPTTFLIDRQGVVRDVRVGPLTEQMLEERLARVLDP